MTRPQCPETDAPGNKVAAGAVEPMLRDFVIVLLHEKKVEPVEAALHCTGSGRHCASVSAQAACEFFSQPETEGGTAPDSCHVSPCPRALTWLE